MPKNKSAVNLNRIILAVIGIILTWGLIVPAFEFPDEQAHLGTVSYLLDNEKLPGYHVPDMTLEMYETQKLLGILRDSYGNNQYTYHPEHHVEYTNSLIGKYELEIPKLNTQSNRSTYIVEEAARYPKLYYAYSGIFMRLANSKDLLTRLFVVRINSLFIAAAMVFTIWKTGMLIFGKEKHALTLVIMTMLQPMMSFVTAGINSDNLQNLMFMVTIYLSLKILLRGFKLKDILAVVIAITLAIYTKPQGFITILIVLTALTMRVIKERRWKLFGWAALVALGVFILGQEQINKYGAFLSITNADGASLVEHLRFSANKLFAQNSVWYWGVFKWLGVVLPPIYWQVANRVVLLSLAGILIHFYRALRKKKLIVNPLVTLFLILSALIYAVVIYWFDWQYTKGWGFSLGIQARYFFPTILSHMAIMQIGILSIGWSKKFANWLRCGLICLFLWLQLGGIWRILSVYYDTSSLSSLITQLSQYKPALAKGNWWYLWIAIYFTSLIYLIGTSLKSEKSTKKK